MFAIQLQYYYLQRQTVIAYQVGRYIFRVFFEALVQVNPLTYQFNSINY